MKFAVQVLAIIALVAAGDACKCPVIPVSQRYYSPGYARVVRAVVLQVMPAPCVRENPACPVFYKIRVLKAYKGCDEPAIVDAYSTMGSANCGITLSAGAEYLMFLTTGQTQSVGRCGGIQLFSELSAADRDFLNTRRVCCGRRRCKCAHQRPTQFCLVEPCQFATPPCAEAVRCSAVCGECRAEWFTQDGYLACPSEII